MEIIRFGLNRLPRPRKNLTLALGEFDGLHRGHQDLLFKAAYEASGDSAILLFATHFPGKGEGVLTSIEDKLKYLGNAKLDAAYILEEDESIYELTPLEFIEKVLKPLGTTTVVVGEDYRFGKGGNGNIDILKEHFKVHVVPFTNHGSEKISTSRIKEAIQQGNVALSKRLLGHPYCLKGITKEGFHVGRTLGFPTLNLDLSAPYVLPKNGVYFALAYFKGRYFKAIVNIGNNPTLGERNTSIEAYLFSYEGEDDYGYTLYLELLAYEREEIKFASLEELRNQIEKDKAWALSLDY